MGVSPSESPSPYDFSARRRRTVDPVSGRDIEFALSAAEELLEKAERRRFHNEDRATEILSIAGGTVVSLLLAAFVVVQYMIEGFNPITAVAAIFFTVMPITMIVSYWLIRYQRLRHDKAGMNLYRRAAELASMVDELYLDVAKREGWSTFRSDAVRVRLSVFPAFDEESLWRARM